MPAGRSGAPSLERLREAVAGRVDARSLRQVAREVGMSPSGLRKFLTGSTPYSATRRKLERWYVRESAGYGGGLGAGSAHAAVRVLVQDLPPRRRAAAMESVLEALESAFRGARIEPPAWVAEVRRLIESERR